MKGDIIIVEDHHRRAASAIAEHLSPRIRRGERPFIITVAGESGSGKSETGQALADALSALDLAPFVFQQDDYFDLPPRSNDRQRRQDISRVGVSEVRLDLLDEHLAAARRRDQSIAKPLVDYEADTIGEERVDLSATDVVVAEGTYTTLLTNVDYRIFIARNRLETLAARERRAREPIEPFIERVLEIEHRIIAPHRERADAVITDEYKVLFVG